MISNNRITSVLGGIGSSPYFMNPDQFTESLAIDPNNAVAVGSIGNKLSGIILPTKYATFSGAGIDAQPNWILTNPKNDKVYSYQSNGKLVSYSSSLGSETSIATIATSSGNGAAYYNDYLYLATQTDVSRYGKLSGVAAVTNNYWTTTLGKTALVNTAYPLSLPNHPMHVHTDNKLYFGDFNSGQGMIHYIKTDSAGADTGATYDALDLPFGYYPTDIESWGTDLVICAIQTISTTAIKQGVSALFFWDTYSSSFYRQVPVNDSGLSAMLNNNGNLNIWGGSFNQGFRKYTYTGGFSLKTELNLPVGTTPQAGAVDGIGDRVVWAGGNLSVSTVPCVYAQGFTDPNFPKEALHCIAQSGNASATSITAIKYAQQDVGLSARMIIGWTSTLGAGSGLDKLTSNVGGGSARWTSQAYVVNKPFTINKIKIPLYIAVAANMTLIPTLTVDDFPVALPTINTTNFDTKTTIVYKAQDIQKAMKDAGVTFMPKQYYSLAIVFAGSADNAVKLPIEMTIETREDNT